MKHSDHIRVTADTLVPGVRFKTSPHLRNWRVVSRVIPLGCSDPTVPESLRGSLLIIGHPGGAVRSRYAWCAQLILRPTDYVYLAPAAR